MLNVERNQEIIERFELPKDIDLGSFNCLGFAVGIYTWLPKGDLAKISNGEQMASLIQMIDEISPGRVRQIKGEEELKENEYICVVFLETAKDFLHAVRKAGNRWIEKNGHEDIAYLPAKVNPLEDENCSWSILKHSCSTPEKYLLAVNPSAPARAYSYMSGTYTYSYFKVDLICEPFEIYNLPYGVMFYEEDERARENIVGEGRYLWKVCLEDIDKSSSQSSLETGILFNSEDYMLQILEVRGNEDEMSQEEPLIVYAKVVLVKAIIPEKTVTISLVSELEPYLEGEDMIWPM